MSGLVIDSLSVSRGGRPVVREISLTARAGEVTVVLGGNGAGKTTLLEAVSGILPSESGTVTIDGTRLDQLSPGRRARAGLAHVQEGRTVFGGLTVEENLLAVAPAAECAEAYALFPELEPVRKVLAKSVSGGQQQMIVVARALLQRPRVLMVDELSLGLAPLVVRRLLDTARDLAGRGIAVLLVEQYARLALHYGDVAHVMQRGRIVRSDSCAVLRDNPEQLQDIYLRS